MDDMKARSMETRHLPRGLEYVTRDVAEVHGDDDGVKAGHGDLP
jgi:hypothetical protein